MTAAEKERQKIENDANDKIKKIEAKIDNIKKASENKEN